MWLCSSFHCEELSDAGGTFKRRRTSFLFLLLLQLCTADTDMGVGSAHDSKNGAWLLAGRSTSTRLEEQQKLRGVYTWKDNLTLGRLIARRPRLKKKKKKKNKSTRAHTGTRKKEEEEEIMPLPLAFLLF